MDNRKNNEIDCSGITNIEQIQIHEKEKRPYEEIETANIQKSLDPEIKKEIKKRKMFESKPIETKSSYEKHINHIFLKYNIVKPHQLYIQAIAKSLTTLFLKQLCALPCYITCIFCEWLCNANWEYLDETSIQSMFSKLSDMKLTKSSVAGSNLTQQLENFKIQDFLPCKFNIVNDFEINNIQNMHPGSISEQLHILDLIRTFVYESRACIPNEMFTYQCLQIIESIHILSYTSNVMMFELIRKQRIEQNPFQNGIVIERIFAHDEHSVGLARFVTILMKLSRFIPLQSLARNGTEFTRLKEHIKPWKKNLKFTAKVLRLDFLE